MTMTSAKGSGAIGTIGGVALGVNSAAGAITAGLTIRNMVPGGRNRRIVSRVASSGSTAAAAATSGGTFGYDPSRQFIILGYSTTINGSANSLIKNAGIKGIARKAVQNKQKVSGVNARTAWAAGLFSYVKISGQRSNWIADAGTTVNSGGILKTQATTTFKSTINGSTDSADEAVTTLSVPGNLMYRTGATAVKITTYPSFTGP